MGHGLKLMNFEEQVVPGSDLYINGIVPLDIGGNSLLDESAGQNVYGKDPFYANFSDRNQSTGPTVP